MGFDCANITTDTLYRVNEHAKILICSAVLLFTVFVYDIGHCFSK